jgi:hypothetical protein
MMKAKVKATGEIVNVYFRSPLWVNGDTKETYFPKELEEVWVKERKKPSKNPDYWTKLEHQYAGMAMQGLMSYVRQITPKEGRSFCDEIVGISFKVAHALVEKMKESI